MAFWSDCKRHSTATELQRLLNPICFEYWCLETMGNAIPKAVYFHYNMYMYLLPFHYKVYL